MCPSLSNDLMDWERAQRIMELRMGVMAESWKWGASYFAERRKAGEHQALALIDPTELDRLVLELAEVLKTPPKCPACGQPVTDREAHLDQQ